ncbi:MAG: STAS domain-containing protein [Candidatus Gastranaerophilales bacterium]|nr:STAS domain-containing protein [Candidatus Gastranaerophilales bacterium]
MELSYRIIGNFCIFDLPKDIFLKNNVIKLKNTINEIIDQGYLNILLNLSNLPRIDGTGLGALLNLQKFALYNEINIRLYGLQPYVAQMMFQTRLNKVFDICMPEEEFCEEALSDTLIVG